MARRLFAQALDRPHDPAAIFPGRAKSAACRMDRRLRPAAVRRHRPRPFPPGLRRRARPPSHTPRHRTRKKIRNSSAATVSLPAVNGISFFYLPKSGGLRGTPADDRYCHGASRAELQGYNAIKPALVAPIHTARRHRVAPDADRRPEHLRGRRRGDLDLGEDRRSRNVPARAERPHDQQQAARLDPCRAMAPRPSKTASCISARR